MKACGDVEDYDEYLKLWREYVNEDTLWYRISVGYVNDFHYMLISDGDHNLWDIRSARYVNDKGDSSLFKADYSEVMSKSEWQLINASMKFSGTKERTT